MSGPTDVAAQTSPESDTAPRLDASSPSGDSSRSRSRSRAKHRAWTWIAVVTTVLLSIGAGAALRGPGSTAPLDPDSATPPGSMALANLLSDRGVSVHKRHTMSEATAVEPSQTLLIVNSPLISDPAGSALTRTKAKRTIVVGAEGGAATLVQGREDAEPTELAADCPLPEARVAGSASFSDQLITGTADHCFSGASGAGLLFRDSLFVLADGSALMNQNLAVAGNAAFSLNLLSTSDEVIWFIPSPTDPGLTDGNAASLGDLLPKWIAPTVWQALVVFVVLALWRGRRLGPLIRESLPIIIPAHETDEGYASLLQRNGQAGVAAAALREASMSRLASMSDLPADSGTDVLAGSLAARLGEPEESIADVLWQRPVTTGSELAELRLELTGLEEQTRLHRSAPTEGPARD